MAMSATLFPHPLGLSWTMDEAMLRSSHALAAGGDVWLVDPVDDPDALRAAAGLGRPAGVVQLLDRHGRDGAAIAARLGVPHHRVPGALPGSPFQVLRVLDLPGWHERALWWPEPRALVVPEAVGTGPAYTLRAAPAGMHFLLRPWPPGALRGFVPEHLLPGHGPPLHGAQAADGLRAAYARARRDLLRLPLAALRAIRSR
jgi:hypothetical protein